MKHISEIINSDPKYKNLAHDIDCDCEDCPHSNEWNKQELIDQVERQELAMINKMTDQELIDMTADYLQLDQEEYERHEKQPRINIINGI